MEWKFILGSEKRKITNKANKTNRMEEIFIILTNDSHQFIIGEYVKDATSPSVVIDGVGYKSYGSNNKYLSTVSQAIKTYIHEYYILNPPIDVKSFADVETVYLNATKRLNELYDSGLVR